jgi:hypothetical protein
MSRAVPQCRCTCFRLAARGPQHCMLRCQQRGPARCVRACRTERGRCESDRRTARRTAQAPGKWARHRDHADARAPEPAGGCRRARGRAALRALPGSGGTGRSTRVPGSRLQGSFGQRQPVCCEPSHRISGRRLLLDCPASSGDSCSLAQLGRVPAGTRLRQPPGSPLRVWQRSRSRRRARGGKLWSADTAGLLARIAGAAGLVSSARASCACRSA